MTSATGLECALKKYIKHENEWRFSQREAKMRSKRAEHEVVRAQYVHSALHADNAQSEDLAAETRGSHLPGE